MKFASFDVYPKTLHEFRQRTHIGAIISIVCATLIVMLALMEIAEFVEIAEAQENQVYLNKSNTVAVAVQTCSRKSCAIHLSTRSTDPTERPALAKRMVALRRKINQGLRA